MTTPREAIEIARIDATSLEALDVMKALDADLQRRYPGAAIHGLQPADAGDLRFTFFVVRAGGDSVGCAALRELDPATGEVKRMFVHESHRGRGIGRRLIDALETRGRELGYVTLKLETGDRQPEAVALYTSAGFNPIAPFGQYVGNPYSRCFEKRLA